MAETYETKSGVQITPHFNSAEFKCKHCGRIKINTRLVQLLEQLRMATGQPVHINSGYRCKAHNKAVGGAPLSQHVEGNASDITVEGMAPAVVAKAVEKLLGNTGGLGVYKSWVHVDVRPGAPARWNEQ